MKSILNYKKYILLVGILIILLGLGYWYYKENKYEDIITYSDIKEESTKVVTTSQKLYVDVKGAVNIPGVYEFNDGDKVIDAIKKAGGLTKNAVTSNINLSKKLTNEMVIYIFTKAELTTNKTINYTTAACKCETIEVNNCITTTTTTKTIESTSNTDNFSNNKVNINTAGIDELTKLSGIGEAKAKAIISYREENGNFKSIEDIKNVSGLGDSLFDKIKDNITVE